MSFGSRSYEFYLFFGDTPAHREPWRRDPWFTVYEPFFKKILAQSPKVKKTGIRVVEYGKKNKDDKYKSVVKLGRLNWEDKSHEKWALLNEDERTFSHFESWTPIWTDCEKNNTAPDVYISFSNEQNSIEKEAEFNIFLVIAIAEDLNASPREFIKNISEQINAKKTVRNVRTWSRGKHDESKAWLFPNWIQDTRSSDIYKKDLHDVKLASIKFEPYWEIVYEK